MKTSYSKSNNRKHKILYVLSMLTMLPALLWGQNMQPMDGTGGRLNMSFKGQYDIKMISAPIIHPVWLKAGSSNSNMDVLREVTTEEQLQFGTITTRNNDLSGPATAPTGAPAPLIGLAYADCDDDMSTFQSSVAKLDFGSEMECTTVQAAYLYWAVNTGSTTTYKPYPGTTTMRSHNGGATGTSTGANTLKFKAPLDAGYTIITADRSGGTLPNNVYFKDVTNLVKGKPGGSYWVADAKSSSQAEATAAWTLVVIFTPPNCPPRTIKFWENNQPLGNDTNINGGWNINLNFDAGEVPNSGNNVSYMGVCALDGEGYAFDMMGGRGFSYDRVATELVIGIKSTDAPNGGGTTVGTPANINVFTENQPYNAGPTVPFPAIDGAFCSRITSYDKEKGTNGNDLTRRPENRYTAGYDAHHIKLPAGAMGAGARSATMRIVCERGINDCGGGYTPFMAYMAIETLQPDLKLYMRTESTSTAPGDELTYVLRIENIGQIASKPTAYVLDTLDKAVDFIPGSVVYTRGTEITPHEAQNVGADDDENLKFYLSAINPAVNNIAQDSVVIRFKVRVKPLDRTDIWSYGCNREIRNRATMVFQADDGSPLIVGSNATAGCGGLGTYQTTPVLNNDLQEQYKNTHEIDATMTDAVNQGNVNIVNTLRNFLSDQYVILGLNAAEIAQYQFYTDIGVVVNPTAVFVRGEEAIQHYYAEALLGDGCTETFYFNILVAKVPKFNEALSAPSINAYTGCAGVSDAEFQIIVSEGDPGYSCRVYNVANNEQVYNAFSPAGQDTYTFIVRGLAAGQYRVEIGDQGSIPATGLLTVADPQPIVPSITTECNASGVLLKGAATARTGATLEYAWKESTDGGGTWGTVQSTAQNYQSTGGNKLYQLTVCDGTCNAKQSAVLPAVAVNPPQAIVSILSPTPQTTYNAVLTGANLLTTYQYAWQLSQGTIPGTLTGANTANLTVGSITNKAMSGNRYKVTVSDSALGCVGTAEGELIAVEAPVVALKSWTQASCPDASDGTMTVTISNGEAAQSYAVALRDALGNTFYSLNYTAATPQEVTASNLPAGSYTWYVTDTNLPVPIPYGAFAITAIARPVTALTAESVCFGATLTAEASGNHPSYEWTIDGVIASQTGSVYTYAYDINTTTPGTNLNIQVVALSALGCRSDAQMTTVTLKPVPDAFAPSEYVSCIVPKEYLYWNTLVTNPDDYQISWYDLPTGGESSQNPMPVDKSFAGKYVKYVVAVGDGCPSLRTPVKITINPNPKVDKITRLDDLNVLIKINEGQAPYIYDFEGARKPFDEQFEITGLLPLGWHHFVVVDDNGCQTEGMFEVKKALLEPASYFSPNNDGVNEIWTIGNLERYLDSNITITIYDRTGKKLAESNAVNFNGWDGVFKGESLPSTDYWYDIFIQKTGEHIIGHFSLKR